jgi:hypothetical protein
MHSSALSLEMWQALGYRQALREHYRLFLPDACGHVRSDMVSTSYGPNVLRIARIQRRCDPAWRFVNNYTSPD